MRSAGLALAVTIIPNGMDVPGDQADQTARRSCASPASSRSRSRRHAARRRGAVEKGSNLRCQLIGYGPQERWLRRLAEDLGLGDRVTFVGRVDQAKIVDHQTAADLFVLTSSYEGMPGKRAGLDGVAYLWSPARGRSWRTASQACLSPLARSRRSSTLSTVCWPIARCECAWGRRDEIASRASSHLSISSPPSRCSTKM